MASVDGVYVGPIALDDVPTLVEQIREGLPPLPGKQLRRRKSTDPGAARAVPGGANPSPPTQYGSAMGGGPVGPPAAIEQPPPPPPEEDA
jgi:hypothetical protein